MAGIDAGYTLPRLSVVNIGLYTCKHVPTDVVLTFRTKQTAQHTGNGSFARAVEQWRLLNSRSAVRGAHTLRLRCRYGLPLRIHRAL